MKKILICGDSFAADWTVKYGDIGWPNMLAKEYKITNLAQAGCSEYRIYKQILSANLTKYDKIIISHTSPYRLYVNKHPVHSNDILHKNSDLIYSDIQEHCKTNKELLSILNYYENYYDLEYAEFIHNLICKEVDSITKLYDVLHITSFNWDNLYKFTHMINFDKKFQKHKGLMNHYNEQGNKIVFEIIKSHL